MKKKFGRGHHCVDNDRCYFQFRELDLSNLSSISTTQFFPRSTNMLSFGIRDTKYDIRSIESVHYLKLGRHYLVTSLYLVLLSMLLCLTRSFYKSTPHTRIFEVFIALDALRLRNTVQLFGLLSNFCLMVDIMSINLHLNDSVPHSSYSLCLDASTPNTNCSGHSW